MFFSITGQGCSKGRIKQLPWRECGIISKYRHT